MRSTHTSSLHIHGTAQPGVDATYSDGASHGLLVVGIEDTHGDGTGALRWRLVGEPATVLTLLRRMLAAAEAEVGTHGRGGTGLPDLGTTGQASADYAIKAG